MQKGTIKFYNKDKGFGFIVPEDGGKEIFLHYTGVVSDGPVFFKEGQQVTYELGQGKKGPCAINVTTG